MNASVGMAADEPFQTTTGLGFGCAELFRLPSARARRRVLDAALDAGIAHFDVAPMYGLGVAEAELGAFARGRRDRIVIATKFGIRATTAARVIGAIQGPVRRLMEARPSVRASARASGAGPGSGAVGAFLYESTGYTAAAARRSLEQSLRALRTDHIDLFLLHDPTAEQVAQDVAHELEQARAQGLIRTWGVAGESADAVAAAACLTGAPPVLQIRDNVFQRSLDGLPAELGQWRITFGALGGAIGRIVGHVCADPDERRHWSQAIGRDVGDPEVVAALLLRAARRRNPTGLTLFGTTRPERIVSAVAAAAGEVDDEQVAAFVALIGMRVVAGDRGSAHG